MQYDAVTLDSNIFIQSGSDLEKGMLAQLSQFKEGSAQLILSEIVLREVDKHLKAEIRKAKEALNRAIKDSSRYTLLSAEAGAQIAMIYDATASPEDVAKGRLYAFVDNTGATIIPAEHTEIKELVSLYFAASPPFEESGKKKNEFPDAIALLSLQGWAKSNKKKVLAISNDNGWANFARSSDWIDVEGDLATALQKLQEHADAARTIIGSLLAILDSGEAPGLLKKMTDALADQISDMGVYGDASSHYRVEVEQIYLTYQDFGFLHTEDGYDFKIIRMGKDKIVARVSIEVTAKAEAGLTFEAWDSIDKEYIPMGSGSAEREIEFEAAVLLTVEGRLGSSPPEFTISEVELVDGIESIDFGEVDIDYEDYEQDINDDED